MFPNLTGPKMSTPDSPSAAAEKVIAVSKLQHLTILPLTVHSIVRAAELCSRFSISRQRYFDAQLIALMIEYSLERIYTENTKDFRWASELGIEAINPLE